MKVQSAYHDALVQAMRQRTFSRNSQAAREWFRAAAKNFKGNINRKEYINNNEYGDPRTSPGQIEVGNMILYNYDPKWKLKLPVYDTFPLVFPFRVEEDRFWGLNMHYLDHERRAKLMDALHEVATTKRYTRNTKLKINYEILKNMSKASGFEDTIHCYLKNHVRSKVKVIDPMQWDYALFLPLAKFKVNDPKYNYLKRGH